MKLETSQELLERVRTRHHSSWYGLARLLPAHENTITNWKAGRTIVGRKFVTRIAELLEEPPEYVLACLEAERESEPDVLKVWQRIAAKFRTRVASVLLAGVVLVGLEKPMSAEAYAPAAEGSCAESVYYGKSRRKLRRWLKKKNGWPLLLEWTWARIRSTGSPLSGSSLSPVPT